MLGPALRAAGATTATAATATAGATMATAARARATEQEGDDDPEDMLILICCMDVQTDIFLFFSHRVAPSPPPKKQTEFIGHP